jgi:hypothetical protein
LARRRRALVRPAAGLRARPDHQDAAYPYHGNGQGPGQVTPDIGNVKNPVLKPWAAAQMKESNEEAARQGTIVGEHLGSGVRQIPFQPISQPHQPAPFPVGPFKPLPINPPSNPPPSQSGGSNGNGHLVSCHPGTGCTVTGNGDRDHDHDHDHDHDGRDHDHDGYYRDHGYGWGCRPEVLIEGVPGALGVPAPVQAVPAPLQAAPARVSVPAAQAAPGPCNCLTKQSLPDGSVQFQDICTKESAIAPPPQAVGAR